MEKREFSGFLKSIFSLSIKAYFLYKASKIVFHDLFSLSVTLGCRGLKGAAGVTGGYKRLHWVTKDYKRSQRVTRGYRGLEGVTSCYRGLQAVTENFFCK